MKNDKHGGFPSFFVCLPGRVPQFTQDDSWPFAWLPFPEANREALECLENVALHRAANCHNFRQEMVMFPESFL